MYRRCRRCGISFIILFLESVCSHCWTRLVTAVAVTTDKAIDGPSPSLILVSPRRAGNVFHGDGGSGNSRPGDDDKNGGGIAPVAINDTINNSPLRMVTSAVETDR